MENMEVNVKKIITSLLTSTPLVVTMMQLNKDYRNTIGEAIPYQKLGYNSLEHFLRSIPDTVQVKGTGGMAQIIPVISEKSAHVNQLVTNQKVDTKKKHGNLQKRMRNLFPSGYNQSSSQPPPLRKIYYPSPKNTQPLMSIQIPSNTNACYKPAYNTPTNQSTNCPKSTISPSGQPASYPESTTNQPLRKDNNVSVTLTQTNLNNNVDTKKSEQQGPLENNVNNSTCYFTKRLSQTRKPVGDLDRISAEQLAENSVPVHIRNNLRALIKESPKGIWCAEIPLKYRKMFGRELDYQELGFKTLIDLCVTLSSIFHYVRPSTDDYKLYDRSTPLPECAEKVYTFASYNHNQNQKEVDPNSALPNLNWADIRTFLPSDIFIPGQEIPRAFVSKDAKEGDNIDIIVGEIYDLSKFWAYLDGSQLNDLMDEIQEFYKEHAQEYLMPVNCIKEGIYCVQVVFGEYHRAFIVDTLPEVEGTVRVIFIDYGTMTKVSTQGICFLHNKFGELPAQAIRCRLANVLPLEESAPWTKEACKAFRKMVVDRDLVAKISQINWEASTFELVTQSVVELNLFLFQERYLVVYLVDVTDEKHVFSINDKLVEMGLAQHSDKDWTKTVVDPIYTPIAKFIHLFPTFLELEHGLAPSTAEMEVFIDCHLPIHFCYPQYFYIDYTREETRIKKIEEFYAKQLTKRKTPSSYYFDLEKLKPKQLDFEYFGGLSHEIEKFSYTVVKDEQDNSSSDKIDSSEDISRDEELKSFNLNEVKSFILNEHIRELKLKEEETVNVLKQDLIVAENIINDISFISSVKSPVYATDKYLSDQCQNLPKPEFTTSQNTTTSWNLHDGNTTVRQTESTNLSDSENHEDIFNHPLSTMTFEEDSVTEGESASNHNQQEDKSSYDLKPPDAHLNNIKFSYLSEENPLSIINRLKAETQFKINSFLNSEFNIDDKDLSMPVKAESIEPKKDSASITKNATTTNPFLDSSSISITDLKAEMKKLNPNNPFLTFLDGDQDKNSDDSSANSGSTVYESPVAASPHHSWASFNDMDAETVSQLGKSLCSKSSSSSSVKVVEDKRSCSTQTFLQQNKAVQVVESNYNNGYHLPQCQPPVQPPTPPYHYNQWSTASLNNPYYSVRFANFQGFMYQSQFGPPQGFAPPPCPPDYPDARFEQGIPGSHPLPRGFMAPRGSMRGPGPQNFNMAPQAFNAVSGRHVT
ncbi:hypothetical protein NQ315_005225 [Exocentrus adspersus]|uniref:Tudor domain-containing protein 5 n=1 Tax=Exocentrus adspersus TaxID=1586481 RepID=A0AAV8W2Q2_9CUCU|nr:hypothetical protein NQ315_005225 [Exocentrus adspersus]